MCLINTSRWFDSIHQDIRGKNSKYYPPLTRPLDRLVYTLYYVYMNNELDKEYQRVTDQLISSRLTTTMLMEHLPEGSKEFLEAKTTKEFFETLLTQIKLWRSK